MELTDRQTDRQTDSPGCSAVAVRVYSCSEEVGHQEKKRQRIGVVSALEVVAALVNHVSPIRFVGSPFLE